MRFFLRLGRLRSRTVVFGIITGAVLIACSLFFLRQWANQKTEDVISHQFNQQQLMLARKIADNIEFYFDFLENKLLDYRQTFQAGRENPARFRNYLDLQFGYMHAYGILEMRMYGPEGVSEYHFGGNKPMGSRNAPALDKRLLHWARDPRHRGLVFLDATSAGPERPRKDRKVMAVVMPLYEASASRLPNPRFAGCLEIIVDPFFVCGLATRDVRSGQTGYAWVVDQQGDFLAHYEPTFVGKHHIKARLERNPAISFARIDEIVGKHLLKGEEGTDWYESGWHREKTGRIRKLVAYTPVRFDKGMVRDVIVTRDHNIWGVGVAAPYEEIHGLIRSFQIREGLLVGFLLLLIVAAGALLIGAVTSWNKALSREVHLKTEALRRSQERLVRSERFAAVGEAAAYVSHEIKNPLMVIGGFARQIDRDRQVPEQARQKMKIIFGEVERLENLLGELRDFTRPAPTAMRTSDLNEVIREVTAMMEQAAMDNGIRLETELEADLPHIPLDSAQIKQAMINLVKNALEAIEGGGAVTIATARHDGGIRLTVNDTGKGIPPDIMRKIFNPFFTTKKTGTGLGLAVANKIFEDHHAHITVESAKDYGTTFTIMFP